MLEGVVEAALRLEAGCVGMFLGRPSLRSTLEERGDLVLAGMCTIFSIYPHIKLDRCDRSGYVESGDDGSVEPDTAASSIL